MPGARLSVPTLIVFTLTANLWHREYEYLPFRDVKFFINHTGDAGFLDTAISGILIPLHLCTSPYLIPLLSLSSWNLAAFSSWSPEKCWIAYSSPNVLLDHFDFFGLFATSLYLDNTTSHASSSGCDCFTLILPRTLDLSGVQCTPFLWLMLLSHFLFFSKNTELWLLQH